jgi:prepilin-type N-terminal cleavage/methylation domain-containing protein
MSQAARHQEGFSLIEVMIAMFILSTGLLAGTYLLVVCMSSNTRNKNDAGGTMVSQMVIEQINTMPVNSGLNIFMTDCNGTAWTVKTAAGAGPGGAGADVDNALGQIDFTQARSSVTGGYQMSYVLCASQANHRATYDVRWNIQSISAQTNLITVSARQTATASGNPIIYSPPVTLRTIQGK